MFDTIGSAIASGLRHLASVCAAIWAAFVATGKTVLAILALHFVGALAGAPLFGFTKFILPAGVIAVFVISIYSVLSRKKHLYDGRAGNQAYFTTVVVTCGLGFLVYFNGHQIQNVLNLHYFKAELHLQAIGGRSTAEGLLEHGLVGLLIAGYAATVFLVLFVPILSVVHQFDVIRDVAIPAPEKESPNLCEFLASRGARSRVARFLALLITPVAAFLGWLAYEYTARPCVECIANVGLLNQQLKFREDFSKEFVDEARKGDAGVLVANPAVGRYIERLRGVRHLEYCSPEARRQYQEYIAIWTRLDEKLQNRTLPKMVAAAINDPLILLKEVLMDDPELMREAEASDRRLQDVLHKEIRRTIEQWERRREE